MRVALVSDEPPDLLAQVISFSESESP